jgi:hypothetical protein
MEIALERRSALCRDVVRGHICTPPYAPYPHRARMQRGQNAHGSLRCVGVLPCVTSTAAGGRQVARPHSRRTARRAPLAAERSHITGHCRPHRACSDRRDDPTSSQPTSREYINQSSTAPRARPTAARAPPFAIGVASVSPFLRPLLWLSEHA